MIRINDDICIEIDELNYTLKKDKHSEYTDKNGATRHNYYVIGYYTNLESALKGAKDYMVVNSLSEKDMSLGEAIRRVREVSEAFRQTIDKFAI